MGYGTFAGVFSRDEIMKSQAGKGDKPRPFDPSKYGANMDAIFRKCPKCGGKLTRAKCRDFDGLVCFGATCNYKREFTEQ